MKNLSVARVVTHVLEGGKYIAETLPYVEDENLDKAIKRASLILEFVREWGTVFEIILNTLHDERKSRQKLKKKAH